MDIHKKSSKNECKSQKPKAKSQKPKAMTIVMAFLGLIYKG
jgi:hypothetical protein